MFTFLAFGDFVKVQGASVTARGSEELFREAGPTEPVWRLLSRHWARGRGPESPLLARGRERCCALRPSEATTVEPVRTPGTAWVPDSEDEQPHVLR